jgi:hypothetical protein
MFVKLYVLMLGITLRILPFEKVKFHFFFFLKNNTPTTMQQLPRYLQISLHDAVHERRATRGLVEDV